ncbi:MAG: T9SS type A sorting domain-containing protein [Bacteroidales bacterium]
MKKTFIFLAFALFFVNTTMATLSTPAINTPASGAVGQSPSVSLSWYSVATATSYEIKWGTSPTLTSFNFYATTTTSYTLNNLLFSTSYYWQVRAKNAVDSSAWSTIWNFTTLTATTLNSPTSASTGQYPSVLLDWYGVTGTNTYQLEIDTSLNYNSPLYARYATTSSYSEYTTTNLLFGKKYYWRVRAAHSADTSAWTASWNFTTTSTTYLNTPTSNSTGQYPSVLLDWYGVTGANTYQLEIDTSLYYNSPLYARYATTSSYSEYTTTNLLFGKKYYWRVRAAHSADTSAWTASWNFTTTSTTYLNTPTSNSTGQYPSVLLDWYGVTGANTYQLEIDTSLYYNSPLYARYATTSSYSEYTTTNLLFGKKYYWRVRAAHSADTSAWTASWNFTTTSTTYLNTPTSNSTGQYPSVLLDWYGVTGANTYQLEIDTSLYYNSPLYARYATTSSYSEYTTTNLLFGKKYYWRVRAAHSADTSAWTASWNFTTVNTVNLYSPSNLTQYNNTDILIDWYGITGSSNYDYLCDTSNFFNSSLRRSGSTTTSYSEYTLNDLAFGKTWYWKVRARHAADTSLWSAVWSFGINNSPALNTPANNSIGLSLNPVISWNAFSGITYYRYQYDTDPLFSNPTTGLVAVGTSQKTLSNLSYGTSYYWRVQAMHTMDTSVWSPVWNFTTLYQMTSGPTLIAPINSSTNIGIPVSLQWTALSGALVYQYQLDINSNFTSAITGNTTQLTASVSSLMGGSIYYWRVRANNGSGYSPWSTTWVFNTQMSLDIPQLLSPSNNAALQPLSLNLDWADVASATSYEYQYSSDITFATYNTGNMSQSQAAISGLSSATVYYWRVRATNGIVFSAWSAVWNFTTLQLLQQPQLISPQNMSVNLALTLTLDWTDVISANAYEYQYSLNQQFNPAVNGNSNLSQTDINGLAPNTQYYWRIRALAGNVFSNWSDIWTFSTQVVLLAPQLIYPSNEATDVAVNVVLNWTDVVNATAYECQYSTDSVFGSSSILNVTPSEAQLSNLNYHTTYYWRVRSIMNLTVSSWSQKFRFTSLDNVGIFETKSDILNVFPNPATKVLNVILNETFRQPNVIRIFDILGRLRYSTKANFYPFQIDVSDYEEGLYFLQIVSGENKITEKIRIMR